MKERKEEKEQQQQEKGKRKEQTFACHRHRRRLGMWRRGHWTLSNGTRSVVNPLIESLTGHLRVASDGIKLTIVVPVLPFFLPSHSFSLPILSFTALSFLLCLRLFPFLCVCVCVCLPHNECQRKLQSWRAVRQAIHCVLGSEPSAKKRYYPMPPILLCSS